MADNVVIPADGTGTTTPSIATDDVGGVHFQKVKLDGGGDGLSAAIGGDAANGLDVDVTRVQGTVAMPPHRGLVGDPFSLVHEAARYTTTQTSAILVDALAGEKLVVTKVQIQVGGTTAAELQLYFGTGTYVRGTSRALFDGEFAPSATLKPGVVMDGPFIAGANADDLRVTTSAALNPLTINVWYYVVT
jgi:hypothetical protein